MTPKQFALLIEAFWGFQLCADDDSDFLANEGLLERAHRRRGFGVLPHTLYQISHTGISLGELITIGEA